MDAKDLRTEAALGERSSDGTSKYTHGGTALPCSRKSYHDVSSNPLAKMDTPTTRPCAVIGPDRVLPPSTNSDAYLKKSHYEPWPPTESTYRPPEYPHKMPTYQCPIRNISPRQTYQENMQRIMVPPTYTSVKINDDANFILDRNPALAKSNKLVGPAESKYCDVPYSVNPLSDNHKSTEMCVSNANSTRNCPPGWHPGGVNIRPSRPYGAPELYQLPEYASCAGPRQMTMTRPPRTLNEDTRHLYGETYYHHGANLRFKPYPNIKERYPQTRYEYVNNYPNPFHPPPTFPPQKYDFQKSVSSHSSYPQVPVKYMENRINDSVMDGYQRSNQQINYNVPYQNQMIHPAYGPMLANALPNKFYQYPPDSSIKAVPANKLPYDNSKLYLEHDSSRNKGFSASENFYMNEMVRPHIKSQVLMSNYPTMNMQPMTHPYYRKESHPAKGYEYIPHLRHVDPNNHMNKMIAQFSPNAIAISPSDSSISNDTAHTLSNSLEDFGYISQSSNASIRSVESGTNRIMPSDIHRRYGYGYPTMVRTCPLSSKLHSNDNNTANSKDTKGIDVRQFLQMWNEGDEESANNQRENVTQTDYNHNPSKSTSYCEGKTQEQLYVLGLVNVPSEELGKYEHIQKVSKLPDNIKGYNNIELLKHFEEAIESSNLNNFNMRKTPTLRNFQPTKTLMMPGTLIPTRPVSPLDVESKISQSIIHKEVGCNFEIKPCSPQMLNVEVATPAQNILKERVIEKVSNPYKSPSMSNISDNGRNCNKTKQEQVMMLNESNKIPSCKLVNTQCSNNDVVNAIRTDYSLQDLESDAGVCFASLPRLDNDIELNFPEVNQQFINANKESVITSHDLHKTSDVSNPNFNNDSTDNNLKTNISTKITPTRESDKEFVKLSKYRKNKKIDSDSKECQSITSSQFLRTDSVIIKNPENTKCYEDSLDYLPNVKYTDKVENDSKYFSPLNTLETNVELPKIDDIVNEPVNEIAVDFSLNNKTTINEKDPNKNNNLNNRSVENMPAIEKDVLECNENTEPLVSYIVAIPPKNYNEDENDRVCKSMLKSCSDNKLSSTIVERDSDSYESFESSSKNDKNNVENFKKISNLSKTTDLYLTNFLNESGHSHVSSHSNDKIEKPLCSDFSLTQTETDHIKTPAVSTSDSNEKSLSVDFYSEKDPSILTQIKNNNSDSDLHLQTIYEENVVHKSENLRDDLLFQNSSTDLDKNETDNSNIVVDTAYESFSTEPSIAIQIKHSTSDSRYEAIDKQKTCILQKSEKTSDNTFQNGSAVIVKDNTSIVYKSPKTCGNDIRNCIALKVEDETTHCQTLEDFASESVLIKPISDVQIQDNESNSVSQYQHKATNDKETCIKLNSEKKGDDDSKSHNVTLQNSACESNSTELDIGTHIINNESNKTIHEEGTCIVSKSETVSDDVLQNCSAVKDQFKTVHSKNLTNSAYESVKPDVETQNEYNSSLNNQSNTINEEETCIVSKSENISDDVPQNCSAVKDQYKTVHSENLDNSAYESVSTKPDIESQNESNSCLHRRVEAVNENLCILYKLKNDSDDVSQNCSVVKDQYKTVHIKNLDNAYESVSTKPDIKTKDESNPGVHNQSKTINEEGTCTVSMSENISDDVSQNCSSDKDQYNTVHSESLVNSAYKSVSTKPDTETLNESNSCSHRRVEAVNVEGLGILHKSEKHSEYVSQNCSAVLNETNHSKTLEYSAHETVSSIATQIVKKLKVKNKQIKNNLSDTGSHYQSKKDMKKNYTCVVPIPNSENDDFQNHSTGIDENETAYLNTFNDSAYESITTDEDMTTQIEKNQLSSQHQSMNTYEYSGSLHKLENISGDVSQNSSAVLDEDANPNTLNDSAYALVTSVYEDTCNSVINTYRSNNRNLRKELFSPWIQKLFWSEGHTFKQKSLVQNTTNLYNAYHNSPIIDGSDITNKISTNIEMNVVECSDFSSHVSEICRLSPIREQIFDTPYNTKSKDVNNDNSFKDTNKLDNLSKMISIQENVVKNTQENVEIAIRDNQTLSKHQEMKLGSNSFLEISDDNKFKCDFENRRLTLKRSLSESAIDIINTDISVDFGNGPSAWTKKRRKINEFLQVSDPHFIPESVSNTQTNRRNSISSMYNEENLSFCIVIENDCIITQENEEEKICFAEISEDCVSEIQAHIIEENMEPTSEIIFCPEEESCEFSEPYVLEIADEKSLEQSWVDDIGCVETVVSDDIAEDVTISAPSTPKEEDILNDDSDIFNNTYEHTDKVKYIYGGKLCNDDAEFVETLYRTPQMNVNRTLSNRESHVSDNFDDFESNFIEDYFKSNVEYSSKTELLHPKTLGPLHPNTNHSCLATSNKEADNSHGCPEEITEQSNSQRNDLVSHDVYLLNPSFKETSNSVFNNKIEFLDKKVNNDFEYIDEQVEMSRNSQSIKKTQDDTVNSCESSIDNVFSYNQGSDSMSLNTPSSPEVSSTTSEEKSSSILLKITNYKGMRTSQLNESNKDNCSNCCKFTENINYNNSSNPRPLITKAAQKYIPPIQEPMEDLKVKLPLPHQSLLKLQQLKMTNAEKKHISKSKKEMLVKSKPRFEDVLKSIDEIQFKKHKEKTKKPKKAVPKVVIKKSENGSHYASMHKKDYYNPDLTGRKWQPWVFIEKNNFIDKMAIRKKTKAIFNHRKNTYVFADKFQKYKSVSSAKFVISQPKLDDTSVGQLKYTIRLKHTY